MCRIVLINDIKLLAGFLHTEDNQFFKMMQRVGLISQMMGISRIEEPYYDNDTSDNESKEICCVLFLPVERHNRKIKNSGPFRNV